MKTQRNLALWRRPSFHLALALALVGVLGAVSLAQASVVVRVAVDTPHFSVRVGSGPIVSPGPYPVRVVHGRRIHPRRASRTVVISRRRAAFRLSKHDRRIARRLSRITGYPVRFLIDYRRAGWTWREISYELGISRAELHAARSNRAFARWMRGGRYGYKQHHGRR